VTQDLPNPAQKQNKNKYTRRFYTLNGETKTIRQWSIDLGIDHDRLESRWKRGIPAEEALVPNKLNEVEVRVKDIPEHWVWRTMIARCTRPSHKSYDNYGGRGIKVCEKWLNSYEDFFSDMGPRPSEKHSIERRNNNEGYGPENCYWADWKTQGNNKRNTIFIEHDGQMKPLTIVAEITGIHHSVLRKRHFKNEPLYSHVGAFTYEYRGEFLTIAELSKRLNLSKMCIRQRIYKGISLDRKYKSTKEENKLSDERKTL